MHLFGLHILDLAIILASLVAILWIGISVSRTVKHENDFYVGGRKMGSVLQFFYNFGTMTDANGAPTVATEVYRQGAAGLWIPFQPLFNTPFYWFSYVWWRRTRLITGSDQFIERFNSKRLATAWAWWGIVTVVLNVALGDIVSFKVASAMFIKPETAYSQAERQSVENFRQYEHLKTQFAAGLLPASDQPQFNVLSNMNARGELAGSISYLKPLPFYIAYTLVVMSYIVLGGIQAAAYTDAVQGILIIIFSFIMIPVGLAKVGGFAGLHHRVPQYMFEVFGATSVSDYAWYSIFAYVLMGFVTIGTPQTCGPARDEKSLRIGVLGGAFGKRFVMVAWMFCGLLAVALLPRGVSDPDHTWGLLAHSLLGPGLLGLMISGILLGHMPSLGFFAVTFGAMFARNLYEPAFPGRSEKHYLRVGKISIVAALGTGILAAMFFTGIIQLFTVIVSINAFFGVVGLLMLFWRRITAPAVGWGWGIWMVLLVFLPWGLPQFPAFRRLPSLTLQTPQRSVLVHVAATEQDVAMGLAPAAGDSITKAHSIAPVPLFFESIARSVPTDFSSPLEGSGRFHLENYILYKLGVPLEHFGAAGLNTCRWLFDSIGPFVLLMSLTYLLPARTRAVGAKTQNRAWALVAAASETPWVNVSSDEVARDHGSPEPDAYAKIVLQGNISLLYRRDETDEQAQLRINRFYAKLKTPVEPSLTEDEKQLAKSFARPDRFDHQKLFPRTNWEFTKWSAIDVAGFLGCWALVLIVLGVLWSVVRIGG